MRRLILGTAGHIDHGKTSLVRALTGVDTDRLPEEKRRGITIELGFAALSLESAELGIVDVPGHEALVRTMLAGASGMDLVLLVIAADEGVMPQTREHLAIMELLEVRAAVVALTKTDLVDDDWLDLVRADIADVLADTRFRSAPIVPVSTKSGIGLDALRHSIAAIASDLDLRRTDDIFRMPVDRVFTRHGTGTVVTGTVWSGQVGRDAMLAVQPDGAAVRARGLQVHGARRDTAFAGERVAIALAVERDAVRGGDTLTADDAWQASMLITARVSVLSSSPKPLRHRQRIRFHLGTAEILARAAVLDGDAIQPGDAGWVQLRLEAACVARAGDRFVVRSYSPVHTIAGGIVAEPAPPKRKRMTPHLEATLRAVLNGSPDDALRALVVGAAGKGVRVDALPLLLRTGPAGVAAATMGVGALRIGDRVYDPSLGDAARMLILAAVDDHHAKALLDPGLPREMLRVVTGGVGARVAGWAADALVAEGVLRSSDGALARAGFAPSLDPAQQATADTLEAAIDGAGVEAPSTAELGAGTSIAILRFLADRGGIIALPGDRWIGRAALDGVIRRLNDRFEPGKQVETADLKDTIGVSRKYLIPILEHLDRTGFTRRVGEQRVWVGGANTAPPTSSITAVPAP
ncbi:MAG TPA: selenocysteine-specific translation elongation factor [Longimicrobiales bacterium]